MKLFIKNSIIYVSIFIFLSWVIYAIDSYWQIWNWWLYFNNEWSGKISVWVGTLTPWAKLDVNGDLITKPAFRVTDGSNTDFVITSWGYVWIGTDTPWSKLSVVNWTMDVDWLQIVGTGTSADFIYMSNSNKTLWLTTNNWDVSFGIWQGRQDFIIKNPSWDVGIWTTDTLWYRLRVAWWSAAVDAWESWTTTSDSRLKKNIIGLWYVLDLVSKLRWVSYNTLSEEDGAPKHIWFIAQELEQYFPELVVTSASWVKWVDYGRVSAILVEAIKELKTSQDKQIEELSQEISELKAELQTLKSCK